MTGAMIVRIATTIARTARIATGIGIKSGI